MPKKSIIKGTIILGLAGFIVKVLGVFFRLPIIYMIGEEGIGLYQLTYPVYTFLLALAGGIPIAISKMVSERVVLSKFKECRRIYRASLVLMFLLGGFSSMFLIFFADDIINYFSWSRESYYSILGISLAPLFTCILSVYRGYFQGLQNMTPTAVSQIIEQIGRVLAGVGLTYILLPYGIGLAAGGAAFGATFGAFISLLFLIILFYKSKDNFNYNSGSVQSYGRIIKELVFIALPISLGQTVSSFMALVDSLTVPKLLKMAGYTDSIATALYGQLTGKAHVLISVPLTLSVALAQSTVPAISEVYVVNNRNGLKKNIDMSFKLASILAFPSAAGLYALARPILSFVFQGMDDGWQLLQILSVSIIFIIFTQVSSSIINGIGKTMLPLISMLIGSFIKIIISIKLISIPSINIKGAAYGTLVSYIIIAIINFYFMCKYTNIKLDLYKTIISPIVCSVVMIFIVVVAYTRLYEYTLSINISTIMSILIGGIVYIALLFITGTISIMDTFKMLKIKR
ncbi:putative polysaccharide biosynthesis protein [Thermobrachium celere]|uniref:Stage V sporulation protein B n=1 Tax=Thermobrachium celere DSM 8682 TaxID=941824 RepID=R7RUM2_9CLOT|nr:polysaccharide biosynthesis protein [Thermobrachium celere]CDF59090.1 Stage V sporulation protein B [Thermobrachium celere DSM 8682]